VSRTNILPVTKMQCRIRRRRSVLTSTAACTGVESAGSRRL